MRGIQIKFNISIIIIAIVYSTILIFTNVGYTAADVATIPGSYASSFAKENHLNNLELADSQRALLDIKYEHFDYNVNTNGSICVEKYSGNSSSLIVPGIIDGHTVTEIGESFFTNPIVKEVYIAPTVISINAEVTESVVIHCDKTTEEIINAEKEDNKKWKTEEIYDSQFVNFISSDIPFNYNDNGSSIEITGYTGKNELIIVPSYIDGKPVTTISMDLLGKKVVLPETITDITGRVNKVLYSPSFAIEFVFTILSFFLAIIVVNIVLPKIKKDISEIILTSPQIILTYIYVLIQLIFGLFVIYKGLLNPVVALIISAVFVVVYVIYIFMASTGRHYEKEVEKHIEERTSSIKDIKSMVVGLSDGIEDKEVKKAVERVVEAIKYMPNVNKNTEVEEKIIVAISNLKDLISSDHNDVIIKECINIIGMIK